MLSIEEAFEVLSEACWWNIRVSGRVQSTTTEREFVGIEKAAARALALAGFELGGLRTCNSSACGSVQPDGSTWRCRHCAARAKIGALGK